MYDEVLLFSMELFRDDKIRLNLQIDTIIIKQMNDMIKENVFYVVISKLSINSF